MGREQKKTTHGKHCDLGDYLRNEWNEKQIILMKNIRTFRMEIGYVAASVHYYGYVSFKWLVAEYDVSEDEKRGMAI